MSLASNPYMHTAGISHAGMSGKKNEDRFMISSHHIGDGSSYASVLAVVADGIGGHLAGEVAAELAVSYITETVAAGNGQKPVSILEQAFHKASQAIYSHSNRNQGKNGMGATCVCAWVIQNRLYTAYVGDSRIYLLRGEYIVRLTIDHSWTQDALEKGLITADQVRNHPNRHKIHRFLGGATLPRVDFRLRIGDYESREESENNQGFVLEEGDMVLLCSDGLTDLVWDDEIHNIIQSGKNIDHAAQALINLANQRGGHDNITVVLLSLQAP